jgi:hypothetical protein
MHYAGLLFEGFFSYVKSCNTDSTIISTAIVTSFFFYS